MNAFLDAQIEGIKINRSIATVPLNEVINIRGDHEQRFSIIEPNKRLCKGTFRKGLQSFSKYRFGMRNQGKPFDPAKPLKTN